MRDWKMREEHAEHLAEHGALCISQCPEIMQMNIGNRIQACASLHDNTCYPVHWYALDTQIEYLDDQGNVIKRIKECSLCGYVHDERPLIVRTLRRT